MSALNTHALAVDRLQTELLKGVAAGSREQFSLLYLQVRKPLLRLVYRYTQCRELIESVVEETLAMVWKNPSGRPDGTRVLVWIMALASQRVSTALKSQYNYVSNIKNSGKFIGSDKNLLPAHSQDIECLIGQMNVQNRVTVELAYYHGFNLAEIATVLDCSESVARVALGSSQERLHEFLNESAELSKTRLKSERPK